MTDAIKKISLSTDSSWTVIDQEYSHVALATVNSAIRGEPLQTLLVDKIKNETGLVYIKDYVFQQRMSSGQWHEYGAFQLCFKGEEPFTLFKMKYYG